MERGSAHLRSATCSVTPFSSYIPPLLPSAVVVLPEKPNRTVPTAVPSAESVGQATQTLADMSSLKVCSTRTGVGASCQGCQGSCGRQGR